MKFLVLPLMIVAVSCSSNHKKNVKEEVPSKAVAKMTSTSMPRLNGDIVFEDETNDIKVSAEITGLKPNSKMGFHIHEKSICEAPSYESAGGHLNPYEHKHGRPGIKSHLGDMGNIKANKAGVAKVEMFLPKEDMEDMGRIMNKAVIIHAKADDLHSQPTGDSGERIACGLIRPIAE